MVFENIAFFLVDLSRNWTIMASLPFYIIIFVVQYAPF